MSMLVITALVILAIVLERSYKDRDPDCDA